MRSLRGSQYVKQASQKALNGSAYRIYKILQWLSQSPLSVAALNERFCQDPKIGKPVSTDSMWLYVNTLKHLGCKIRRPSLRNQFQYELLYHPFGMFLSDQQLEILAQVKMLAQKELKHSEIRTLDGLFKKIIRYGSGEHGQHQEHSLTALFTQSRSLDYESCQSHIEQLEKHIAQQPKLLHLTYLSPLKGEEIFYFMPMGLFYEQGILYLRGERAISQNKIISSYLRVDRIRDIQPVKNTSLLANLQTTSCSRISVTLHIQVNSPTLFQGFLLTENHGVYKEDCRWIPSLEKSKGYYCVDLSVRDFFFLKQRLLSCGFPFHIISPADFRDEVITTLRSMLSRYQRPASNDIREKET